MIIDSSFKSFLKARVATFAASEILLFFAVREGKRRDFGLLENVPSIFSQFRDILEIPFDILWMNSMISFEDNEQTNLVIITKKQKKMCGRLTSCLRSLAQSIFVFKTMQQELVEATKSEQYVRLDFLSLFRRLRRVE